jgi:hypothetical protein
MSRESYGGGGQYGMGSSSSSNASSGGFGGGRDASQPDFSPPSAGGRNDNKDPTVQYQNTTPLSTEAKETLAAQRQKAQYEISPMTDPKNKAIALGLNLLVPGLGGLYGTYKTQTAMGYSIQNPFEGIFEGGEPTLEDISNLRDGGGDNRDIQTQVISQAPFAITQTEATPSIVNEYFANLNIGQQASSDLQTRYNSAKSNITNILNLKSVEDQFGYVAQPNLLNLNLKGLI